MEQWERTLILPSATLRQALEIIDEAGSQLALVVNADRCLLGTLSDGDIRRALLRGFTLSDYVDGAMHRNPAVARAGEDLREAWAATRRRGLHHLPQVDGDNRVVGLIQHDDNIKSLPRDNWVIIMAGGLGTRLGELTLNTPKPMLEVGARPLIETIIRGYASQGFRFFYVAVNYRAEQIEAHLGDGRSRGVQIRYVREDQRLGTAGAISLHENTPELPFIVTNADLLTTEDYGAMVDQHVASGADATMGVRHYEMKVPFGVVNTCEGAIISIDEKPTKDFCVSAGMYVLPPKALELVPGGQSVDMPAVFEAMIDGVGIPDVTGWILIGWTLDAHPTTSKPRRSLEESSNDPLASAYCWLRVYRCSARSLIG